MNKIKELRNHMDFLKEMKKGSQYNRIVISIGSNHIEIPSAIPFSVESKLKERYSSIINAVRDFIDSEIEYTNKLIDQINSGRINEYGGFHTMKNIDYEFKGCRYGIILTNILKELNAIKVLRCEYEDDYQGFVDVDVLLKNGKVFSYRYSYGSCVCCDEWEGRNLTDTQIEQEMLREATIFNNIKSYNNWRKQVDKKRNR